MNTSSNWGNQRNTAATVRLRQWNAPPSHTKISQYFLAPTAQLAVWSVGTVALLGMLIYLLPYTPTKTPCFVLIESNYTSPLPLNPFAQDDLSLLQNLDGQTLSIYPSSPSWQSVASGLSDFSRLLKSHAHDVQRRGCCIVYINAIGLVNESGEPCIVPATANPHDGKTWIPVQRLLDAMAESLPTGAKKLVILDCARIQSDWDLGVFYNGFVEKTGRLLEQGNDNTILLTSSGPGEIAWPRSSFALNVAQGLAGLATDSGSTEAVISATQLHRFVSARVQAWAINNRGESQTPQLFTGKTGDAKLAITTHPAVSRRLADHKLSVLETEPSIAASDLTEFWKKLSELRSTPLRRLDPIRLRNLTHALLRLEELRSVGQSRTAESLEAFDALKGELETLSQSEWTSLTQQWTNLAWAQPHLLPLLRPHSIDVAQSVGLTTPVEAEFQRASIRESIRESRGNTISWPSYRDDMQGYAELQFLQISAAADTFNQWAQNNPSPGIASLRERASRQAAAILTGTFDDLRVQTRLRPRITTALDAIRAAEDALWGSVDRTGLQQHSLSAQQALDDLTKRHASLSQAYQIADGANSELVYFGKWLSDLWMQTKPEATLLDQVVLRKNLVDLASNLSRLNVLLAGENNDDEALKSIAETAQSVSLLHQNLQKAVSLHADNLIDQTEPTAARWRQMHALLGTPLVVGQQRQNLRERYDDLRKQLLNAFEQMSEADDLPEPRTLAQQQERIENMLAWAPQVACLIAAPQQDRLNTAVLTSVGNPEDVAETVNQRMRRHLLECTAFASVIAGGGQGPTEPNASSLASREARIRLASGLWFAIDEMSIFQYQHLVATREHFLWLADEALRDNWGGQWFDAKGQASKEPFFAAVAEDYIQAAESIILPKLIEADKVEAIRVRLNRQRLSAMGGLSSVAKDSSSAPGLGEIQIDAKLTPVVPEVDFAPGIATIFVRLLDGRRINVQPASTIDQQTLSEPRPEVRLPLDAPSNQDISVRIARGSEIDGRVILTTFFRGLEFTAPFTVNAGKGAGYAYEPKEYGNARLTITGEARQQPSILFVLDCSASMADPIAGETPGLDSQTKLDIAKSSLAEMLDELAIEGQARVGVIVFGHRMGWSKTAPVRILTQPQHLMPIPDNITPSTDIETVLPLGRFDSTEAAKLEGRLGDLAPWGQSPVHLSILKAMDSFSLDSTDTDKCIVVITDGINYQFTPADRVGTPGQQTSLTNVLQRAKADSIPIHILGFGVDQGERAEAKRVFEQIADASNGSYRIATNGRDLLRLLKSRLGVGSYSLKIDSAARLDTATVIDRQLNETVQVPTQIGNATNATVSFRDAIADIKLYDGQWLQLLATNRPQIRSVPYEVGSPTTVPLVGENGRDTGHVFRVHRPVKRGNSLDLTVSLQSQYKVSTARPTEVWLEVTPVSENAGNYYFYDSHFQPFEPVPVLSWTAANWPREARTARVRFWCKFETTRATKSLALSDLLSSEEALGKDAPLPGIAGVTCRVEIDKDPVTSQPLRLRVLEFHNVSTTPMSPVRITLSNADDFLIKVERYMDSVYGVCQHVFHFNRNAPVDSQGTPAVLNFTAPGSVKSQAWRLQDGSLDVEISDFNAVLPLASH